MKKVELMADTEKHTLKEWKKKLGTEKKFTKEEYEKILKRQNTVNGLLKTGKNILQGIGQNVSSVGQSVVKGVNALGKAVYTVANNPLADNFRKNYMDTYQGSPFASNIKNAIGLGPRPTAPVTGYYDQFGRYINRTGQYVSPWQYPQGVTPQNQYSQAGPQYPQELFKFQGTNVPSEQPAMSTIQPHPITSQPTASQPTASPNEPQDVFLFDDRTNTVSEILGEFNTVQEAEAEVKKLRGQGLPAYYATRGAYINKIGGRLKA